MLHGLHFTWLLYDFFFPIERPAIVRIIHIMMIYVIKNINMKANNFSNICVTFLFI